MTVQDVVLAVGWVGVAAAGLVSVVVAYSIFTGADRRFRALQSQHRALFDSISRGDVRREPED